MMQAAEMDYHRYIRRKWLALVMMAAAAASMCLVSLMCGSARLSLADVLGALFLGTDAQMRTIVMNVRLPRIAAAAAAGFALSISGCIMQNVLRKALTSPNPAFIDVMVEREENVYPMVPAGAALDEMLLV